MSLHRILILDYSVDKTEAFYTKQWLPENSDIITLFIDTEASFPDDLLEKGFTHVIHTGSALSITKTAPFTKRAVNFIQGARDRGIPQMGICYGAQLLCLALVGDHAVRSSPNGLEAGWREIRFINSALNVLEVKELETVWQEHFDEVIELPEGSELLATNEHTQVQAFVNYEHLLLGTQFHPEFDKESGDKLFQKDKECLERHGFDLQEILSHGPSFDVGRTFFDFFLAFKPKYESDK